MSRLGTTLATAATESAGALGTKEGLSITPLRCVPSTGVESVAELEQELHRIPGIMGIRVVLGPTAQVTEVHVVADDAKHPKQIVRDVQTVALASAGVEIDRRVVSVVQLAPSAAARALQGINGHSEAQPVEAGDAVEQPGGRWQIVSVSAEQEGLGYKVDVTLAHEDREVIGTAEGPASRNAMLRVVARATLAAVLQVGTAQLADVEAAAVVRLADRDVALVTVLLLGPSQEDLVVGSAIVRGAGPNDAVARAVLDATNRRLGGPGAG